MNRTFKRLAVPLTAAAVLGTAGFAFMANNVVPRSFAGTGEGAVSGYVVSNIHWETSARSTGDPVVSGVSFNLNHPATNVSAYIYKSTTGNELGAAPACTQADSTTYRWTCTFQTQGNDHAVVVLSDLIKLTVSANQ